MNRNKLANNIENTPKNNPLKNMDPISQIHEFKENIKELDENIKNIVKIVKPMVHSGLVMPCNISKKISNTLCSLTDSVNNNIDKFDESINNINLTNIVDKKPIFNSLGGNIDKSQHLNRLPNKTIKTGRYFGRNRFNQEGGKYNSYNYIINPETGRKVSINGKKGRQIIEKYIQTLFK